LEPKLKERMSMLIWMREGKGSKIVKYVLFSMLVMAVAGLVLMDVGGFFRADSLGNGTLVKGGGVKITAPEFNRTVGRVLASQNMSAEEAYRLGLINQVLQSEVQSRLIRNNTRALGIHVGDETLSQQIAKLAESLPTNGGTKRQALQQMLRQQGITEGEFIESVRAETSVGILLAALKAPSTLNSPLLAQSLYRYDNETRRISYFVMSAAKAANIADPTEDDLKQYYESNKTAYLIPETRTITMATLKPEMLEKSKAVTDEQLRAEYDKHITSFTKPARRLVEQAVFDNEADAKKTAEAAKQNGKGLKEAAPTSAYMGAQEFEQNGLLPEIAKPVFSAKENDVIGPVKTDLGYHVLVVQKNLPESVTPFEEVKSKLAQELQNISGANAMFEAANTIEDRVAAGDSLEDIVQEYGMTTSKIGPFRVTGRDAGGNDMFKSYGGDRDKLIQAAYDYDQGEVSSIVETADGQFHIIRVEESVPDTYRPFESVRSDIEKQWIADQRQMAGQIAANHIATDLNAGKIAIDSAAREHGGVKRANINRKENPAQPLTPMAVARAFATDNGESFVAGLENGNFLIARVDEVTLPDNVRDDKELTALQDLVARSLEQDVIMQYVGALTRDKEIKINQRQLEVMYGIQPSAGQVQQQ
jgi:peptidyl-prolyl cis-trans isomerase D